jgi:hypothetical protein
LKRAIISVLAALALLSALAPLTAWQNTPTLGVLPDSGPALPATCVVGQIYFKTAATAGLNQCTPANTWTALATGAGAGTVTNTGGALTANAVVLGAGGNDTKVVAGITTDGTSKVNLASGGAFTINSDVGLSRIAANQMAVGNGTAGNETGFYLGGGFNLNPVANTGIDFNFNTAGVERMGVSVIQAWTSGTEAGTRDTGLSRSAAGVIAVGSGTAVGDTTAKVKASGYMSVGTKFTTNNGCTDSATTGGATAGTFTVGSTSCTEIVTMGDSATAPNGWSCTVVDITTLADVTNPHQTTSNATTATIVTGTVVSGDKIQFSCIGY